jgi:DNA-binding FadR family transcriptional regulator
MENPAFAKVRSVRAHEQIVEQLQQRILRGELPAGSHLPSERAMMTQFQVSRPTVREALRVAEHLGLVTVRQGDPAGPLVIAHPSAGISRVVEGMLQSEQMSLGDLLELRMVLDGTSARLASKQTKAAIARITAVYEQMCAAPDLDSFARLDARFHYEIASVSGNRLFALTLEALDEPIRRLIASNLSAPSSNHTREATIAQHGEILALIRKGDGDGASAAALRHLHDLYAPALNRREQARLALVMAAA